MMTQQPLSATIRLYDVTDRPPSAAMVKPRPCRLPRHLGQACGFDPGRSHYRSRGRPNTEFGPGFYTTTSKRQAHMWAAQIAATSPGTFPAVIEITVKRLPLALLETIAFVRGDFDAEDYWSLIHHCRKGALDHGRPKPSQYYDVVYGPVAAFWTQRMIIADADQISFHTANAEALLNKSARNRII